MTQLLFKHLEKAYHDSFTTGKKILEMEGILTAEETMAVRREFPLIEINEHTNINRTVFYLAPRRGSFKHRALLLSYMIGYFREELPLELQSHITLERFTLTDTRGIELHFCSLNGDYVMSKVLSKHRISLRLDVESENDITLTVVNKISSLKPLKPIKNQPLDKIVKPIVEYFFEHKDVLCNLLEKDKNLVVK